MQSSGIPGLLTLMMILFSAHFPCNTLPQMIIFVQSQMFYSTVKLFMKNMAIICSVYLQVFLCMGGR